MKTTYKEINFIEKFDIPLEEKEKLILVAALSFSLQEDSFLSKDLALKTTQDHNYLENILKGIFSYDKLFISNFNEQLISVYRTLFPNEKKVDVSFRKILSSNKIYCYIHLYNIYMSERFLGDEIDSKVVEMIEKELKGIDNIELIFNQSGLIPNHIEGPLYNSWARMVDFSHKVLNF